MLKSTGHPLCLFGIDEFHINVKAKNCTQNDLLYLAKSKSNVYLFLQVLDYRVLSVPGKKFNSQPSSVFKLILLSTLCCNELEVT